MLLEANNVSKAFGSFLAVSGADLTVEAGEKKLPANVGDLNRGVSPLLPVAGKGFV